MSAVTLTGPLPLVVPYRLARFSVAEYQALSQNLSWGDKHPIELLKGVMVEKFPLTPLHACVISIVQAMLCRFLPPGFLCQCQLPITLRDSEPEPDISICGGPASKFFTRHPGPAETQFVIEVASTSLLTDRFEAEIYAEAGIPWYWIVNLTARCVEVYSLPAATAEGLRYGSPKIYEPGDVIPVMLDGNEIGTLAAAELLPAIANP